MAALDRERTIGGSSGKAGKMNNQKKYKILIVDDDPHVLESLAELLGEDYDVLLASSGDEAIRLANEYPDIITAIIDIKMAPMDGIEVCHHLRNIIPDIEVIFHTAHAGSYDEAEINERQKPFDLVRKGRTLDQLLRSLGNIVAAYELKHRGELFIGSHFYGLVGRSKAMIDVYCKIKNLADSNQPVLLLGESGAGKEMVAKALHACSRRRGHRFRGVNPKSDSTDQNHAFLFGAVKGAYTGLDSDRVGVVEAVGEGTLLLDEIGDYSPDVQEMLLRFFDSGEYERLGDSEVRKSRARLLFATNQNLEQLVAEKRFREDLWYRIKGASIVIPPLRERKEDIKALTEYFVERYVNEYELSPKIIDDGAYAVLLQNAWPGNVRELMNCVQTMVTASNSDLIFAANIAEYLETDLAIDNENGPGSLKAQMNAVEKEIIIQTLIEVKGDVKAAAAKLKINRANLYKKFKEHGIEPNQFRTSSVTTATDATRHQILISTTGNPGHLSHSRVQV